MLFEVMLSQRQTHAIMDEYDQLNQEPRIPNKDIVDTTLVKVNWKRIISEAISRGVGDCAICMCSNTCVPNKALAILSCSHVFHHQCIENFEKFCASHQMALSCQLSCPVCRANDYEKQILDHREVRRHNLRKKS